MYQFLNFYDLKPFTAEGIDNAVFSTIAEIHDPTFTTESKQQMNPYSTQEVGVDTGLSMVNLVQSWVIMYSRWGPTHRLNKKDIICCIALWVFVYLQSLVH